MISPILSEEEFKKRLAFWTLDNDIGATLPQGYSREDYAESFRLPDFDYVHTQSMADENGDLLTLLKSSVHLSDWQTRNHREERNFEFYLVLKTLTDCPEVEPFPVGYIISD